MPKLGLDSIVHARRQYESDKRIFVFLERITLRLHIREFGNSKTEINQRRSEESFPNVAPAIQAKNRYGDKGTKYTSNTNEQKLTGSKVSRD